MTEPRFAGICHIRVAKEPQLPPGVSDAAPAGPVRLVSAVAAESRPDMLTVRISGRDPTRT
jgi:hypothetical protein